MPCLSCCINIVNSLSLCTCLLVTTLMFQWKIIWTVSSFTTAYEIFLYLHIYIYIYMVNGLIVCYAFIGIILMRLDTMEQWGKPLTFSSCKEFTIFVFNLKVLDMTEFVLHRHRLLQIWGWGGQRRTWQKTAHFWPMASRTLVW